MSYHIVDLINTYEYYILNFHQQKYILNYFTEFYFILLFKTRRIFLKYINVYKFNELIRK